MIFLDLFENNKLPSNTQGVAEGSFDNASPMTKDTVKSDRIRSLKNLIAIAKEKGRQLRVQELELELKKLQGVAEGSLNENADVLAGLTDILKIAATRQAPQNPRYFAQQVKDAALQFKDNPATQKWVSYLDGVVRWADVIANGKEQYSSGFADEVHSVLGPATRAYQDALLNKQGVAEGYFSNDEEREQSAMDVTRSARQYREREPAGSEKIDAMLARRNEQLRQYELSGKYWLKTKDTQQHVEGPFTGKQAANAAAIELLKRAPELKGNLLITAKGPNDKVDEAARLPYPEGSENLGRANMELLIRAYNEPTSPRLVLNFGNQSVDLDRDDINAIADYYDDQLPSNDARWNFIRAVMSNYENFTTVLGKLGRRKMPVDQPGLFQEENKKKDDDLGKQVRDVGLQRAITRAKADFPTAGSGIEALAKDFMRSQDQDRRDFDQLQQAERRQDKILGQIAKVDQEQAQEINDLENKNSTLLQRIQQLQSTNSRLEKTLADMSGRQPKEKKPAEKPSATATTTAPAAIAEPTKQTKSQKSAKKQLPNKTQDTGAIKQVAKSLAPAAAPQISNQPSDNILPPMFRKPENPAFAQARTTATDTPYKLNPNIIVPGNEPNEQELELASENKKEADYGPEFQEKVKRLSQMAKEGPRKTVWDPVKRVYKTVPVTAPKQQ